MVRDHDRVRRPANPTDLEASLQALARKLEYRVLALADSLRGGENLSTMPGRGVEFSGIREYQHGDEARDIDWRVTARRGRPFAREYSQERELPTLIVLHMGPSLFAGRGLLKATRCREVAALLAALALQAGDRVGLLHSGFGGGRTVPVGDTRGQLALILREMLTEPAADCFLPFAEGLGRARFLLGERARVLLVNDFRILDHDREDLRQGLQGLSAKHHVIPVRISDQAEGRIPPIGAVLLRDPPSGRSTLFRSWREGPELRRALRRAEEELASLFRLLGLTHWDIDLGESLVGALQRALSRSDTRTPGSGFGAGGRRRARA